MGHTGNLAWILQRVKPYTKLACLSFAATILAGSIGTIDPLLMRHLVDQDLPQHRYTSALFMAGLIALCFSCRSMFSNTGALLSFRVTQKIGQDLRVTLLEHMTRLSADWYENTYLGEKLSRFDQDIQLIAEFSAEMANSTLKTAIFFCINLAIMLSLNWRMTLTIIPLFPVFLWVRGKFRARMRRSADVARDGIGKASASLTEHLAAVPHIQILGAADQQIAHTVKDWLRMMEQQWKQRWNEIVFSAATANVLAAGILLVLTFGVHEYFIGSLSLGTLFAFYAYVTRIFEPISTAMELYSRTQRTSASIARVREVLTTSPTVEDRGALKPHASSLSAGLTCRNVSFSYEQKKPVLRDVSFHVDPLECIALIGKSGSGKSTLSRLMARVSDPAQGEILLDGRSLKDYQLESLRGAICYVPQQPILFSGTIRENLLYANRNATDQEIYKAVEVVQLLSVLDRLPHGPDTQLGPEAVGLSGGERQRLAVARGLLRRSPFLILDESTSALDLPTERAILQAIAEVRRENAPVVISHRVRSLTWVDRIVLLEAEQISAQGTHSQLYLQSALYRSLYERRAG